MSIDPVLMNVVACPACHAALTEESAEELTSKTSAPSFLVCSDCGLAYPVRDGVPVLLIDHASRT